jgi:hypothetical protein
MTPILLGVAFVLLIALAFYHEEQRQDIWRKK